MFGLLTATLDYCPRPYAWEAGKFRQVGKMRGVDDASPDQFSALAEGSVITLALWVMASGSEARHCSTAADKYRC